MTTKRSLENEVEQLKDRTDDGDSDPLVLVLTHFEHEGQWPTWDESPHPELTVQPYPERKPNSLKIAVPNHIPTEYLQKSTLMIRTCENGERYGLEEGNETVTVVSPCELWGALSDEDLREEYKIRKANGDPIPAVLEDYAED